ncbi:MAG: phosphatase PAP2 family protein [Mycobacteriales bacterium]
MSTPPDARGARGEHKPIRRTPRAAAEGRWGVLPTRWRLRRSPRWWQEILFILISYLLYGQVRNNVGGGVAADCGARNTLSDLQREACGRALDIWLFEKRIGAGFELAMNNYVADIEWLAHIANYWYAIAHFLVTVGILVWIYKWHPLQYRGLRTALYSTNVVALLGYTFYELAPPRMLTQIGFIDTIVLYGQWGSWGSGGVAAVSNQFAAMPSMHVAWSTWVAIALVRLSPTTWARVCGVVYPLATFVVIVVTGNHFWLDALGGLVALWLGFLIQRVLSGQPAVDIHLEEERAATAL